MAAVEAAAGMPVSPRDHQAIDSRDRYVNPTGNAMSVEI
jgi:hypothetical protein